MAIEEQPPAAGATTEFSRRRGDRRRSELSEDLPDNRRTNDRRRNKPGFFALIGALFANKE